jgi:hypothetical protein
MDNTNNRIKTALEIAMERAQRIKISPEGLEKQRYIEEGKKLASKYLKSNDFDLESILNTYKGKAKNWVKEGAQFIFRMKLTLPRTKQIKMENERAMKGMVILQEDKKKAKNLSHKIEMLFNSYERERKLLYERVKAEFEAGIEEAKEALEGLGLRVEVENQPQFQKKWSQILGELELKYQGMLKGYLEAL